jgi:hypothetical protein
MEALFIMERRNAMGYRSDVSLTIKNADFETLLQAARNTGSDVYDFVEGTEIRQTAKYTTICWSWVKWYEDYPGVQFIESFKCDVHHVYHDDEYACNS